MYCCVRFFYRITILWNRIFQESTTLSYTPELYMVSTSGESRNVKIPEFSPLEPILIETVRRRRPDGRTDYRHAIQYADVARKAFTYPDLFEPVSAPWFMIQCDGKDMTETLAPYVCNGNTILPIFLNSIQHGKWVYMHPKTFEDTDFPSCGIVINV